jgi:hypothetical protein
MARVDDPDVFVPAGLEDRVDVPAVEAEDVLTAFLPQDARDHLSAV